MAEAEAFHSAPITQDDAGPCGQLAQHQTQTMGDILPFSGQKGCAKQHPDQGKQKKQGIQAQNKKLFQGRLPPFMSCR